MNAEELQAEAEPAPSDFWLGVVVGFGCCATSACLAIAWWLARG